MLTSLAMIITLTGIGLSVVVLGTTLLSEANIILAPGFWLLAASYSLALTGVLLLRAGSFELVPKSFSSILLVVSPASGVVAATHAGAPQFLRCSGQGDGSSGALIFSADANNLMALHLSDGGRAWACSYFNHAISPPATTRDMFIGVSGTSIFALRMADGALRWQHATDLCAETATFSIDDMALNADTLFLIIRCQSPHFGFGAGHFTQYIVALSLVDGSQRWLLAKSNMTILGTTVDALLLALPTTIPYPVNGHTQYNGQILALNSANGFIKWQIADSGLAMTPLGILAGQPDGTLAMLNANTGALIWHSSINVARNLFLSKIPDPQFGRLFDNDAYYTKPVKPLCLEAMRMKGRAKVVTRGGILVDSVLYVERSLAKRGAKPKQYLPNG